MTFLMEKVEENFIEKNIDIKYSVFDTFANNCRSMKVEINFKNFSRELKEGKYFFLLVE